MLPQAHVVLVCKARCADEWDKDVFGGVFALPTFALDKQPPGEAYGYASSGETGDDKLEECFTMQTEVYANHVKHCSKNR
ncbi:MAG: hypothetical protein MUD01_05425 [Chloroflexaceae bacterium]|jgi:hypothetical protein|nr:hypothetical protein [Chloroflexaceae bacterium]